MSRRMAKHTLMVLAPLLGSAGFAQPGSQKDEKANVEEFRARYRSKIDLVAGKSELVPSKLSIMVDAANIFQEMLRWKVQQRQCESRKRKVKWIFAASSATNFRNTSRP